MFNELPSKQLFTRRELWYHSLMMPVLFSAGNYLFLRERYFSDPVIFGWGTLLVFFLYWLSLVVLTAAVKGVFRQFPDARQVRQRNLVALLVATTLTIGLATFDVWAYSLFSVFNRPFDWSTVQAILLLGFVFDLLLCFMLGIQYTYTRWQESQTEKEQLKSLVVQHQLDRLKQQINPHFLFNALNSISSLIAEDPKQAEVFIDEMANVYRYMLQAANQHALVALADEVQFVQSYIWLLRIRYKTALQTTIHIDARCECAQLPPLTLQILLDDIIQHNTLKPDKPLHIQISTTPDRWLRISHNRQPRTILVDTRLPGLDTVINRYRTVSLDMPVLENHPEEASILLPLVTSTYSTQLNLTIFHSNSNTNSNTPDNPNNG